MSEDSVDVVLYSSDSDRRKTIIEGAGIRPAKGAPKLNWIETATAPGAIEAVRQHTPPLVVLDADTPKVGGMAVLQDIKNELEQSPVVVLLTARPQDQWLATWAGATYTVLAPYDPLELQQTLAQALAQLK